MRVVLIHHHLRQGGVTRVITEQINSLTNRVDFLVICGEPPPFRVSYPWRVIPSLAYNRDRHDSTSPDESAAAVLTTVRSVWSHGADVYHIHNPTLGKNRDYLRMIKILLSKGVRTLLQIHDFAEDGRPQNYSSEDYPENCHYAVINSRDYSVLQESGWNPEGLHLLPNPVRPLPVQSSEGDGRDLFLYPVRAIRRKNIGEAVLLSLFLKEDEKIGVTLEPTRELDVESYRGWMSFVEANRLNVLFRLGVEKKFEDVLSRTACIITTSIKEGFGLAFLESWTGNRPLFGRLLHDICADFIRKGIKLEHLYRKISIPVDMFDRELFGYKWKLCYAEKMKRYGIPVQSRVIERYFQSMLADGQVDFGVLSEDLQKQVILRMVESMDARKIVLDINSFLKNINDFRSWGRLIEGNRRVVEEEYSLGKNGDRLLGIYKKLLTLSPVHAIDRGVLLRRFNTPEQNHLLLCDASYG